MPRKKTFNLRADLERFTSHETDPPQRTRIEAARVGEHTYPRFINAFWTARQRQACSLHEVAYRACFKPQLPRFFIERLTQPGDTVYDPFAGRGTTILEAGLLGRQIIANDINPLSAILAQPRFCIPDPRDLQTRLAAIPFDPDARADCDLAMFYHPQTLAELASLRNYLRAQAQRGASDQLDAWIRMVATNRLTGHSSGFFSVYTLPPNQAVSPASQRRINRTRAQTPPYRDTRAIILKKSRQLIKELSAPEIENLRRAGARAQFLACDARATRAIANGAVQLTVTSPPFLDIVQYAQDNWLRCWFNEIDAEQVAQRMTQARTLDEWRAVMGAVFAELYRITRRGGWVAFEVGEVRHGKINLDEHVVALGIAAGFECHGVLINQQTFTKTANIWGVANNTRGTNTNRVGLFRKA